MNRPICISVWPISWRKRNFSPVKSSFAILTSLCCSQKLPLVSWKKVDGQSASIAIKCISHPMAGFTRTVVRPKTIYFAFTLTVVKEAHISGVNTHNEKVIIIQGSTTYHWMQKYHQIWIYERESKSNAIFFSTGIITDTITCIIYQNKNCLLWIISLFLNIVNVSINRTVLPLNESLYSSLVKFWLLFLVDFLPREKKKNKHDDLYPDEPQSKIRRVRPNFPIDNVPLLHDNARPHTSIRTRETIASWGR